MHPPYKAVVGTESGGLKLQFTQLGVNMVIDVVGSWRVRPLKAGNRFDECERARFNVLKVAHHYRRHAAAHTGYRAVRSHGSDGFIGAGELREMRYIACRAIGEPRCDFYFRGRFRPAKCGWSIVLEQDSVARSGGRFI